MFKTKEDIKSNVREILSEEHPKIIKNEDLFNLSTTPSSIYQRQSTKDQIFKFFIDCAKSGLSNKLIIIGKPGTGKTVTVKYYTKELSELKEYSDKIKIYYLSGKTEDSTFKCFKKLVSQLDIKNKVYGYSKTEVANIFLDNLSQDCLIILDEVDKIRDSDFLIYTLTRAGELNNNFKNKINLLVISNDPLWYQSKLDKATQGTLGQRTIVFQNYTPQELYNILKIRADEGLYPGTITENTLDYISKKVVKNNDSDSRMAIEILGHSANYAQSNNIQTIERETVDDIYNQAVTQVYINCLQLLDRRSLEILNTCVEFKSHKGEYKSASDIYRAYVNFCKKETFAKEPISYSAFRSIIENLESLRLIRQFKKKNGGTFHNVIEILIQEELIKNYLSRCET